MKRIFALILCFVMVLSCVPVTGMAQTEVLSVYLDSANGLDTNSGLTEAKAVKTFAGAYKAMHSAMADSTATSAKIVLVSDYDFAFTTSSYRKDIASATDYAHSYDVTICGKTADISLTFTLAKQSYLGLLGPTTFENINMRLSDSTANKYLSIHGRGGSYLKIGQNVTTSDNTDKTISLSAAPYFNTSKACSLEINSGAWRNAYASAYTANVSVSNKVSLTVNGGSVSRVATVYNGKQNGDVTIAINGGTVGLLETGSLNTGTVTGNVTTTITGGTVTGAITSTAITGTNTMILAPTKGVTLGTSATVNSLTGGSLTLGTGVTLTVTDSVTGTTNVTVTGGIGFADYVFAPVDTADSAVVFTQEGVKIRSDDVNKIWGCNDTSNMRGLALQAKKGVTVKLYTGFKDGSQVTPNSTVTKDGVTTYYFLNIAGSYRYVASGTGYCSITKYVYVSNDEAKTLTTMDVTPGTLTGEGWESTSVIQHTDELLKNRPDDASLWPEFQEAFQTPFFLNNHADHQFVTQTELEAYLADLAQTDPHMYIYSAGKSGNGQNIPLVIFTTTDLSGAQTIEQAAALLRANGKMTIHYQGQMHGNEQAGGEGALAMVKKLSGSYGDKLLQNLNVYIIPRLNPDGAKNNNRKVTAANLDMNRDYLLMRAVETKNIQYVAQIFEPDMMLDSHEYNVGSGLTTDMFADMLISPGFHTFNTEAFRDTSLSMTQGVFGALAEQNLTYTFYQSNINSKSDYIGRNYATAKGTLFFLMETRGIDYGSTIFGRRVVSHLVTATQLFDYAYEHHEELMALVEAEREHISELGATYDESNLIALETGTSKCPEYDIKATKYYTDTGKSYSTTVSMSEYNVLTRSRVAPTAYVLPAGESWIEPILELMDRHGITYTFIPEGSMMDLRQYSGTTTSATLLAEETVTFTNGAYVFTMNQVGGRILANLMEPDVTDISAQKSTLVMAGMIPTLGEGYALYRYVHDLNEDGFVDYIAAPDAPTGLTVQKIPGIGKSGAINGLDATKLYEYSYGNEAFVKLPAGTTSITVTEAGTYYVRFQATETQIASVAVAVDVGYEALPEYVIYLSTAGSDSSDGMTADSPVATIPTAYSLLEALLTGAPEGTEGKIVVDGVFNLGSAQYNFPEHTFPVTIVGQDASDGFTHKGGSSDAERTVYFNGPTTLDNLTWKLTNSSNFNYFGAKGHKLVIGEGFTSVLNNNSTFYNLCGGSYSGDYASTELVVKGGTWRNIYYGTYKGNISGDASLIMTGGTYTSYLQTNYNGIVSGNATAELSGCKVGSLLIGGNKNTGTVEGDVTVTLGAGITGTATISPVAGTGTIGGTFTLILDGADTTGMTVSGDGNSVLLLKKGTVTAFTGMKRVTLNGTVKLGTDISSDITVEGNSVLNLNGKVLTGNLSGSGTLYGMDTATDSYTASTGRITGTVSCTVATHYRDSATLKRYLAIADAQGYTFHRFYMGITHMNLRPDVDGVGYKAVIYGDDQVQQQVAGYGYSLWLGADGQKLSTEKGGSFTSGQVITARLQNFDVANYGETPVNGSVFIKLQDGTVIESTAVSFTLRSILEHVADYTEDYSEDQLSAVKEMVARFSEAMSGWNISALR